VAILGIEKFGALLHEPWERGETKDSIAGTWAEDGNEFLISLPEQLVDLLIDMQNELHSKYYDIRETEKKLSTLKSESSKVFS
jgi:hypothetical protein